MKRDIHGRFSEFSLTSFPFIVKYFLLLIVLLPWIHLVIYRINIGKLIEELLFTLLDLILVMDLILAKQKIMVNLLIK